MFVYYKYLSLFSCWNFIVFIFQPLLTSQLSTLNIFLYAYISMHIYIFYVAILQINKIIPFLSSLYGYLVLIYIYLYCMFKYRVCKPYFALSKPIHLPQIQEKELLIFGVFFLLYLLMFVNYLVQSIIASNVCFGY